jgi:hypothetical protein
MGTAHDTGGTGPRSSQREISYTCQRYLARDRPCFSAGFPFAPALPNFA